MTNVLAVKRGFEVLLSAAAGALRAAAGGPDPDAVEEADIDRLVERIEGPGGSRDGRPSREINPEEVEDEDVERLAKRISV